MNISNLNKESFSSYERVTFLGGKESIELVREIKSGSLYVKKTLKQYDIKVYETLQRYQIPGIPRIVELFQKDDTLIVLEEYISGQNLFSYLQNKLFTLEEALEIFLQLEKILTTLHSLYPAIIHRDIKPSNVLLTSSGDIYLIDFNAARQFETEKNTDTVILGTNGYASPEQYGFAQTDPRSDVYSLAVMFCVMTSGQYPTEGLNYPKKLKRVLEKAMDLSPGKRYMDVKSFITALSFAIRVNILSKIPGFRHGKLSHKICAISIYFAIFISMLETNPTPDNPFINFLAKILYIVMWFLSLALCIDFGEIRRFFPGAYHPKKVYRYIIIYIYISLIMSSISFIFVELTDLFT